MSNYVWHVALEPGTTKMQDVILVNLSIDDLETIGFLLSTDNLKGREIQTERGNYVLVYGGVYKRPYPSIMIWRYSISNEQYIIEDMRQQDAWVLKHIWKEWLMPEGTTAEFIPPDSFLLMGRTGSIEE